MARRSNRLVSTPPKNLQAEIGHSGISTGDDLFYPETIKDLTFPYSVSTYEKMSQNIIIASALSLTDIVATRTPLYFEGFSKKQKDQDKLKFIEDCFEDMTHSMRDFILDALTAHKYGFSIIEKVYRFRNKKYGSKFDDGLVGIKRLPLRHQSTITGWDFDKNLRELTGFYQQNVNTYASQTKSIASGFKLTTLKQDIDLTNTEDVFIPRDSFLHIKVQGSTGNPEGKSPLQSCYTYWRGLQKLLNTEEIACYKNLNGIAVMKLPSLYMAEDATPEQKAVLKAHRDGVTKLGVGEQTGVLIPSDRDDNGSPYFDFSLESSTASNITAISSVIKTRCDQIYQNLFSDILILNSGTSGAVKNKAGMLNMLVEARLGEICDEVNNDLIPDLFEKNGWDKTETPNLMVGEIADIDMEVFAKAMQQLKATKLVPVTAQNINFISKVMQLPYRFDNDVSQEELDKILQTEVEDESRSGDGLAKGSGNGTSDNVSEDDNSANNLGNS